MPKTSHYLTTEEKELLQSIAAEYGLSQSTIVRALIRGKGKEILEQDGEISEDLKELAKKVVLTHKLKELRDDGKLLARDVAYASVNKRRALKAIEDSDLPKEVKEQYKTLIEQQAEQRIQIAEELLNPRKGGMWSEPPENCTKEWYVDKIKELAEDKLSRKVAVFWFEHCGFVWPDKAPNLKTAKVSSHCPRCGKKVAVPSTKRELWSREKWEWNAFHNWVYENYVKKGKEVPKEVREKLKRLKDAACPTM